jgi:hypothetical protein
LQQDEQMCDEQTAAHAQQQEQMGWLGSAGRFFSGWGGGGYELPK